MRIGDITYRVDGAVILEFLAWPGVSYTLRASTNLTHGTMPPTLPAGRHYCGMGGHRHAGTFPGGTFSFVDTAATNYPARFYRLTWP